MYRLLIAMSLAFLGLMCAQTAFALTYSEDVQSIFEARCVSCHQPGQIAPMSLRTYDEVRPWAKSIAREVAQKRMPPFHASGPIGRYVNDIRLTPNEIDTIVRWEKEGARPGPPRPDTATPETRPQPDRGEPDLIIKFPRHDIPAGKVEGDPYVFLYSDEVIEEDIWFAGYEWSFTDYRVVHHAVAQFAPVDAPILTGEAAVEIGVSTIPINATRTFASWFPGKAPVFYPEGTARLLEKGSRLAATVHYSPTSEETSDQPAIGLYLYSGELRNPFHYKGISVKNAELRIPPGAPDHSVAVEAAIDEDAVFHSFNAHMHYRGDQMRLWHIAPDGAERMLFEVPNYNFDWQRTYTLRQPLQVGGGSTLRAEFTWDNSAENPYNPDPTVEVLFGSSSYDEMGGIQIGLERELPAPQPGQEPILASGKLVSGQIPEAWAYSQSHEAFINRALNKMDADTRAQAIQRALERMTPEERAAVIEAQQSKSKQPATP